MIDLQIILVLIGIISVPVFCFTVFLKRKPTELSGIISGVVFLTLYLAKVTGLVLPSVVVLSVPEDLSGFSGATNLSNWIPSIFIVLLLGGVANLVSNRKSKMVEDEGVAGGKE